jgi:hypothetical protein
MLVDRIDDKNIMVEFIMHFGNSCVKANKTNKVVKGSKYLIPKLLINSICFEL